MSATFSGKNYWIIGASSGIGHALSFELARRGARLALSARREDALRVLAAAAGPGHAVHPLDVTSAENFSRVAGDLLASWGRIDGVILMSATYTPAALRDMELSTAADIVNVNLMGALNCLHSVLPLLRAQGGGQLALCGSVAGYRGLPRAQPYAATKAAVISLAETARIEEQANGIDIRVINPGFVRTPMTGKNDFEMPAMIEPEEAARRIADGLLGSAFEIHFPRRFTFFLKLLSLLPDRLYFPIVRRFL